MTIKFIVVDYKITKVRFIYLKDSICIEVKLEFIIIYNLQILNHTTFCPE